MFQRGRQSYSSVDSTGEQHILTVLRFHEVRLGKIEKHLINTNKQLEHLIMQRQPQPTKVNTQIKTMNNTESFTLLKNMMTNLTEQVEVSQSFMKEIKEVVGNLKLNQVEGEVEDEEDKEESSVELNSSSSEHNINSKLLELERNIAKASIISIGMEPTVTRIDEYVERNRRDRKRFLNNLEVDSSTKKVLNEIVNSVGEEGTGDEETREEEEETSEEEELNEEGEMIDINNVVSHSIVDDTVLENDIIKLKNLKSHIEEEVQEVLDKIPVIIKSKKKRRGRPKKDIIA